MKFILIINEGGFVDFCNMSDYNFSWTKVKN